MKKPTKAAGKKRRIRSPLKQKLILLLQAGLALGLTRSYSKQRYIIKQIPKEFKRSEQNYLRRLVSEFHHERLVDFKEQRDGSIRIVLTEKGELVALRFNLDNMKIKRPIKWDGWWRVVFFDVPEKKRNIRDAFRRKLQELNFYELQKSCFVHPYPCLDEINFVVECFEARPYVRCAEMKNLTNEAELRLKFKLI